MRFDTRINRPAVLPRTFRDCGITSIANASGLDYDTVFSLHPRHDARHMTVAEMQTIMDKVGKWKCKRWFVSPDWWLKRCRRGEFVAVQRDLNTGEGHAFAVLNGRPTEYVWPWTVIWSYRLIKRRPIWQVEAAINAASVPLARTASAATNVATSGCPKNPRQYRTMGEP